MRIEAAGKNAKRVLNDDGSIVGFALELANGRWAPFDKDGSKRLVEVGISFKGPRDVLRFFKASVDGLGASS